MSDNWYYVKVARRESGCNHLSTLEPSLRLHRLVHFLHEVSCDLLFTAVLQVEEELVAVAPCARPQDDFPTGIDELNRRLCGVLPATLPADVA